VANPAFAPAAFARKATAPEPLSSAAIESALDAAYAQFKDLKEGANADYIPALAKVDSNIFGIALVTADGRVYTKGDVSSEVSIQSISKVFTMAKVIESKELESDTKKQIEFLRGTVQLSIAAAKMGNERDKALFSAEQQRFALEALKKPQTRDTFEYGYRVGIVQGYEAAINVLLQLLKEERDSDPDL
jgi:hypothetical protein